MVTFRREPLSNEGAAVGTIGPRGEHRAGSFLGPLSLGGRKLLTQGPLYQSLFAQLNGVARDLPTHLPESASPLFGNMWR